jgi:hypothetical protein
MLTPHIGESKPLVIADCRLPIADFFEHLELAISGTTVQISMNVIPQTKVVQGRSNRQSAIGNRQLFQDDALVACTTCHSSPVKVFQQRNRILPRNTGKVLKSSDIDQTIGLRRCPVIEKLLF